MLAPVARSAPGVGLTWQASSLDLPLAWQVTSGSATSVVAVVDSGVQADNPALQGRVLAGYDFVHGDTNTTDDNGHGTAVAGIIAAVCPGCSILPVKVLDANGTGDWPTISAGIDWAADHGAQVINLSVGAPRALDIVGAAVAYAISKGAIVVAAAGNDGEDESFYPAMYPGVISVAGVDQTGARSTWSNFGSWVTVAAPGCAKRRRCRVGIRPTSAAPPPRPRSSPVSPVLPGRSNRTSTGPLSRPHSGPREGRCPTRPPQQPDYPMPTASSSRSERRSRHRPRARRRPLPRRLPSAGAARHPRESGAERARTRSPGSARGRARDGRTSHRARGTRHALATPVTGSGSSSPRRTSAAP